MEFPGGGGEDRILNKYYSSMLKVFFFAKWRSLIAGFALRRSWSMSIGLKKF